MIQFKKSSSLSSELLLPQTFIMEPVLNFLCSVVKYSLILACSSFYCSVLFAFLLRLSVMWRLHAVMSGYCVMHCIMLLSNYGLWAPVRLAGPLGVSVVSQQTNKQTIQSFFLVHLSPSLWRWSGAAATSLLGSSYWWAPILTAYKKIWPWMYPDRYVTTCGNILRFISIVAMHHSGLVFLSVISCTIKFQLMIFTNKCGCHVHISKRLQWINMTFHTSLLMYLQPAEKNVCMKMPENMTLIVVLAHQIQRAGQLPSSDSRLTVQDFAFIWLCFAVVLLLSVIWWVTTQRNSRTLVWCCRNNETTSWCWAFKRGSSSSTLSLVSLCFLHISSSFRHPSSSNGGVDHHRRGEEQSHKVKPSIYRPVSILTAHLWSWALVITERTRSQRQAARLRSHQRVAGFWVHRPFWAPGCEQTAV